MEEKTTRKRQEFKKGSLRKVFREDNAGQEYVVKYDIDKDAFDFSVCKWNDCNSALYEANFFHPSLVDLRNTLEWIDDGNMVEPEDRNDWENV